MKVTVSYYIEPAPDQKGWNNKCRYASNALRFEVINKDQNKEDFLKIVNVAIRGEDKKDKGEGSTGSDRSWVKRIGMLDQFIPIFGSDRLLI